MPECFVEKTQIINEEKVSSLEAASRLGLNVIGTSPFMQGLMLQVPLPTYLTKANYQGAKHLNFVRSLPYKSLKSVIFGAKNNRHVKTNLTTCYLDKYT